MHAVHMGPAWQELTRKHSPLTSGPSHKYGRANSRRKRFNLGNPAEDSRPRGYDYEW